MDKPEMIRKVVAAASEEADATKMYANMSHELRQLGYPQLAEQVDGIAADEARHMGILSHIADQLIGCSCKCPRG